MNQELVLLEEGKLGVREPHTYSDYFTQDKTVAAVDTLGETKILENGFQRVGVLFAQGVKMQAFNAVEFFGPEFFLRDP